MTQTAQRARQPKQCEPVVACVCEIRLLDGDSIWAQAREAARVEPELDALHARLGTEPFVRLGHDRPQRGRLAKSRNPAWSGPIWWR